MSIGHGRGGPTDVGSVTRTSHLPSSSETVERPGQSRGGGGAEGAARAGAYDGITRNVKFHCDSYWAVYLQRTEPSRSRCRPPVTPQRTGTKKRPALRCACWVGDRGAVPIDEPAKRGRRAATRADGPEDRVGVQLRVRHQGLLGPGPLS